MNFLLLYQQIRSHGVKQKDIFRMVKASVARKNNEILDGLNGDQKPFFESLKISGDLSRQSINPYLRGKRTPPDWLIFILEEILDHLKIKN